jgi:DNA-binding transcriptional LysR family regulator
LVDCALTTASLGPPPQLRKYVILQLMHANMQPMLWDDLRVFLAIQRLGGQKRAARALGIDPTTVGRRLSALESALGARLFLRTPERLQATPAGVRLLPYAERIEAAALEAERELLAADTRLEGSLRVTATDGFVHYVLIPALSEFRQQHPLLTIDLRADVRVLDLSRREADVAVRLLKPKQPALIARRLGTLHLSLFASQAYLDRRGAPRNSSALSTHDFIGFEASLDDLPQTKWLRRTVPEPRYVVRATTTTAQVVACAEGHGIALLPTFTAAKEARLKPVLPRLVVPTREMWGVIHADLRANVRTVAFLAWLTRVVGGL